MRPALWLVRRVTWRHVSLAAALALVAQSEWQLAVLVGWPVWIAWAAPLALDAYVLAAVTARRDLGWSVTVSTASVFASHGLHHQYPDAALLPWWVVAFASAVPLLVTWRVHHLPQEQSCPKRSSVTATTASSSLSSVTTGASTAAGSSTGPKSSSGSPARGSHDTAARPATPQSTTGRGTSSVTEVTSTSPSASTAPAVAGHAAGTATNGAPSPTRATAASPARPGPALRAVAAASGPSRAEVRAKLIANGHPIPSQTEIARAYGVSKTTAARAWRDANEALTGAPV